MGAPTENQFWRLRKDMSEDGKKLSVEEVITKTQEYIDYCRKNSLIEIDFQAGKKIKKPRMRVMTLQGLWHHLNITPQTWQNWKNNQKYFEVISRVENLIYVNKFEGAAANFLNANIIARDLGLVDKKDHTTKGKEITPMSEEDIKRELREILGADDTD